MKQITVLNESAQTHACYTSSNAERFKQSQKKLLPVAFMGAGVALFGGILVWLWKRKK